MREPVARGVGFAVVVAYAIFIASLYVSQPRTLAEAVGGITNTVGAYTIDAQSFADGLSYFRKDQFVPARAAFARADPANRDARTQFYIAYSFYRQGWHRFYSDDVLFARGVQAVDRAIAAAPDGRVVVDDDADLRMHTADELRAELQAGLTREAGDLNPLRALEPRK